MTNLTKRYLVGGVLVEATKTLGGGFYDVTVLATKATGRYLAEAFEKEAKEVPDIMSSAADPEAAT
jgi:hypothetical protein